MVECLTPASLRDLYSMLAEDKRREFLRLLGSMSTAEVPFEIVSAMDIAERQRFADMVFEELQEQLSPIIFTDARRLAQQRPELSDNEFDAELLSRAAPSMERYNQEIRELERTQLKRQRDRNSDPETTRRNVEICNQRKQDRNFWSLGKLAKTYGVTTRAITKIIKEEQKWRREAGSLPPEPY